MHVTHDESRAVFLHELDKFVTNVRTLSDLDLLAPSRCTGWSAGDVLVHVHLGLQEMLLGLVTPAVDPPDVDAATYWQISLPTNDDEADRLAAIRFVRLVAAAYQRPSGLVRHLLPTAEGIRSAVTLLPPGTLHFQGHVLTTGDFLATWAVELAIHQLDLSLPPTPPALHLSRQTIEALTGQFPADYPDDLVALLGAGRLNPTPPQTADLGPIALQLPALG